MCKAPDPPKPQPPEKPEFLHNEYLDSAMGMSAVVGGLRSGRSSLRIPLGSGLAIQSAANAPPPAGRPDRFPSAPPGRARNTGGTRGGGGQSQPTGNPSRGGRR